MRLQASVDVVLENVRRMVTRRRCARAGFVDPEMLPEWDRALVLLLEQDHEEVRACVPIILAEAHVPHLHCSLPARVDDVGVGLAGSDSGLILVREIEATNLEATFDGQSGIVMIEKGEVEEVCCGDVGYDVLLEQVERKGGVDESRIVEGNPCSEVGPCLGIAGVASRCLTAERIEPASTLVPFLPVLLLAFLRLTHRRLKGCMRTG